MITITCVFIILLAGAVGGLVNALLTNNGFILPKAEYCNRVKIVRPGVLGNCLISAVAAFISWGLYSASSELSVTEITLQHLKFGPICGALLVGVAGAKWLTNEVDKNLLRAAATQAAKSSGNTELSQKLAMANPAEALQMAKEVNGE
jgi:hypothetical protein